jgi:hypothetical protein
MSRSKALPYDSARWRLHNPLTPKQGCGQILKVFTVKPEQIERVSALTAADLRGGQNGLETKTLGPKCLVEQSLANEVNGHGIIAKRHRRQCLIAAHDVDEIAVSGISGREVVAGRCSGEPYWTERRK